MGERKMGCTVSTCEERDSGAKGKGERPPLVGDDSWWAPRENYAPLRVRN